MEGNQFGCSSNDRSVEISQTFSLKEELPLFQQELLRDERERQIVYFGTSEITSSLSLQMRMTDISSRGMTTAQKN